jgi:hypothetical protein
VTTGGHLHDGGVSIPFLVNNKTVCESKAIYSGASNSLTDMTECNDLIPVKKGDIITLAANYDLETHPAYVNDGYR